MRLQFPILVPKFCGVAKSPRDLAANGLSRGCVLHGAFRHLPLSINDKMNALPLEAAIEYLAELRAVSIRVELAFVAPDRDDQSRTAGLIPHNVCPSCLRGNGLHGVSKVHALSVGEILLLCENGEREFGEEKW